MSNYIPHDTKKLKIFRKKEDHLRRLIGQGADREKCLHVAEEVRLAKIRALKLQSGDHIPGTHGSDAANQRKAWRAKMLAKSSALENMTAETFLAEFR